jgi:hypothetical protein
VWIRVWVGQFQCDSVGAQACGSVAVVGVDLVSVRMWVWACFAVGFFIGLSQWVMPVDVCVVLVCVVCSVQCMMRGACRGTCLLLVTCSLTLARLLWSHPRKGYQCQLQLACHHALLSETP